MDEVTVRAVVRVVVGHVMLQPGEVARVRADIAEPILASRPEALVLVETVAGPDPEPPAPVEKSRGKRRGSGVEL
jgi:hypothetical protein